MLRTKARVSQRQLVIGITGPGFSFPFRILCFCFEKGSRTQGPTALNPKRLNFYTSDVAGIHARFLSLGFIYISLSLLGNDHQASFGFSKPSPAETSRCLSSVVLTACCAERQFPLEGRIAQP